MIAEITADAFTPFDRKPRPIVPEASTYGAILILLCFLVLLVKKYRSNAK
jgi:hypothetical protein